KAGRLRAVVEHVPLMSAATGAVILGARQDELVVDRGFDAAGDALVEARPSGAAVVFGLRLEEGQVTAGADERPLALFVVEGTRERGLGAFLAQHVELRRREQLA